MKILKILCILGFAMVMGMVFSSFTTLNPLFAIMPFMAFGMGVHLGFIPMPSGILALNFGAITTVDIVELDGREAMGGYTMTAYLWLLSDVQTFPTQPNKDTVTSVKDLVRLIGNFIMGTGKYMYEVKVKMQTTSFDATGQGETGGKSFKNKISFFIPGIDPSSAGLARYLNNKYGGLIIPDPNGLQRVCIGTKDNPCEFKPSAKSGAKSADVKGFTFEADCDSFAPGWFYEGAIPLSGSTLAGES